MAPAESAQTINLRRDAVLRSRNGSAPQPAATAPNTATQNVTARLLLHVEARPRDVRHVFSDVINDLS